MLKLLKHEIKNEMKVLFRLSKHEIKNEMKVLFRLGTSAYLK